MEAYQIIFNILLYFSEGLILFYYADSFFERKYSALKTVLCVSAFHIALFGIYYLDNTILNLAALFAAYCLVFSLLYKCKILSSIFNSTLLLAVMWICEWAVLFITTLFNDKDFNAYQYSPAVRIFDTTLSKLAYYLKQAKQGRILAINDYARIVACGNICFQVYHIGNGAYK